MAALNDHNATGALCYARVRLARVGFAGSFDGGPRPAAARRDPTFPRSSQRGRRGRKGRRGEPAVFCRIKKTAGTQACDLLAAHGYDSAAALPGRPHVNTVPRGKPIVKGESTAALYNWCAVV